MRPAKESLCPQQDFYKIKRLGLGKYAKVFLCKRKTDGEHGRHYAMKEVRMNTGCYNDYLMRERNLLIECQLSPFIVSLCCAFQDPPENKAYLILELGAGGDLYELHENVHLFNECEARFYLAEMICGLEFLHDRRIIHRDLKGENILLTGSGHVMLCDLGLARQLVSDNEKARTFCGTLSYMSPEMVRRQRYTTKTDVWSLGVLLAFLVTGEEPILGNSDDEKQSNILKGRYHLSCIAKMSYACKTLISNMLKVNPDQRPTIAELKSRRFLNKLDWLLVSNGGLKPPYQPQLERKVRKGAGGQHIPSKSRADSQFKFHAESNDNSATATAAINSNGKSMDDNEISCVQNLDHFDWIAPDLVILDKGLTELTLAAEKEANEEAEFKQGISQSNGDLAR